MDSDNDPQQTDAYLLGQVSALGIAMHVLLKTHPQREAVAAALHDNLERLAAKATHSSLPDEFLRGLVQMRDTYLLKPMEDPGQPTRR